MEKTINKNHPLEFSSWIEFYNRRLKPIVKTYPDSVNFVYELNGVVYVGLISDVKAFAYDELIEELKKVYEQISNSHDVDKGTLPIVRARIKKLIL